MASPKGGYYLDGESIPSVTTVIGRFKDCGGLIHWSWKLGTEGKDYRAERDKAADAGTLAHKAVEAWTKGQPVEWNVLEAPDAQVMTRARKAFEAFLEWADQTQLKVTETELPLVSRKHRFGGTFDAILVRGKRAMGDWKSSGGLYPEYLIQVAAYGELWRENFPDQPLEGGYHLLRFDKEYGDFHHHWWGELDAAWQAFLHLRALYDLDKELKARAK